MSALNPAVQTPEWPGRFTQAWLADVLNRIPERPRNRIDELLPWTCTAHSAVSEIA